MPELYSEEQFIPTLNDNMHKLQNIPDQKSKSQHSECEPKVWGFTIHEPPELAAHHNWTRKIFKIFPALKNRNYQLYFSGQIISHIGTWLQTVAQGWLVLELTNSAFYVGLVLATTNLPTLIFCLPGGVMADRFNKRRILLITQSAFMALAFILGALAILKIVTVWEILIIGFLFGCVKAVDAPARQAFAVDLVGKADLTSAIALNSAVNNGSRVIGPGLAGFLIALFGAGGAFIINGLSYIAILTALIFIKTAYRQRQIAKQHPLRDIIDGLKYVYHKSAFIPLLTFAGTLSIFAFSYTTIFPVIARDTFQLGAAGLGYLYSAAGLGALTASVIISSLSKKISNLAFISGGNVIFILAMSAFTFTNNFFLAVIFLYFCGVGLTFTFPVINNTLQHLVDDRYRGRVVSLYILMFIGVAPLGNLQIGYLADRFNPYDALRFGVLVTALASLIFYFYAKTRKELFITK